LIEIALTGQKILGRLGLEIYLTITIYLTHSFTSRTKSQAERVQIKIS